MKFKKLNKTQKTFIFLFLLVTVLLLLNLAKVRGLLIPSQPGIEIIDNTISLDDFSIEQKIAQMVIVHGGLNNLDPWKSMQLGGVHLFAMESEEVYITTINKFQKNRKIPFFVTVDLEGCNNPFANFRESIPLNEINSIEESFEKGKSDGQILSELRFTTNFAPVVDLQDNIWKCRTFPGDEEQISLLAEAYSHGLQSQHILSTAKHYPGKTLIIKDPHKFLVSAEISYNDLYPYSYLFNQTKVDSVMVSHIIANGQIDSSGIPSVASKEVIGDIKREFNGLIVTDEINMLGLKNFYSSLDEMYLAVFSAGNDLILNFNEDPNEIYRMINLIAEAVRKGIISEEQIDASVRKILEVKGFKVE